MCWENPKAEAREAENLACSRFDGNYADSILPAEPEMTDLTEDDNA